MSDILIILFAIGFIYISYLLLHVWQVYLSIPFLKVRDKDVSVWDGFELPSYMQALHEKLLPEITELGFEYVVTFKLMQQTGEYKEAMPVMIYKKADGRSTTFLEVMSPMDERIPNQLFFSMSSVLSDGSEVTTVSINPLMELLKTPKVHIETVASANVETVYKAHEEHINSLGAQVMVKNHSVEELRQYFSATNKNVIEYHLNAGSLRTYKDHYRFTFFAALKRAGQAFFNKQEVVTDLDESPVSLPLQKWFLTQKTVFENLQPPIEDQWKLFFITLVFSILLGRLLFDWQAVFILTGVIIFHELGHFMAMRFFGYKKTRIYMLPLIGGVAIGHEQKINYNHRAWMVLMGPLPGILLGIAIYYYFYLGGYDVFLPHETIYEISLFLILINAFNLLPFLPLDGGQLLQFVLPKDAKCFKKWVMVVLSSAGIIISVIAGLHIIALILAFPLYFAIKQKHEEEHIVSASDSRETILQKLCETEPNPLLFQQHITRSKTLYMETNAVGLTLANRLFFSLIVAVSAISVLVAAYFIFIVGKFI